MDYRYHIQHSEETYQHFFRVRRYQVAYESFRGGMLENIERECLGAVGLCGERSGRGRGCRGGGESQHGAAL